MKKPFSDINDDIPYLDRSVVDETFLTEDHRQFRKQGFLEVKKLFHENTITSFLRDKSTAIYDIVLDLNLLKICSDLIGDDVVPRFHTYKTDDPGSFNWWCVNAFVALEPTQGFK